MAAFVAVIFDWSQVRDEEKLRFLMRGDQAVGERLLREGAFSTYRLEAADPEEVFRLLNIDHPADYQRRSMSVGDLAVSREGAAMVAGLGWAHTAIAKWCALCDGIGMTTARGSGPLVCHQCKGQGVRVEALPARAEA